MEIPGGLFLPQRSPPHAVEVCLEPGRACPWGPDGDLELKGGCGILIARLAARAGGGTPRAPTGDSLVSWLL